MTIIQNLIITLILRRFLITSAWADMSTFPPTLPSQITPKDLAEPEPEALPTMIMAPFINPRQSDYYRDVDEFTRGDTRFLVVKAPVIYYDAEHLCKTRYYGHLVIINDLILAKYIAIALSELSVLEEDTLWVGGLRDDKQSEWYWQIQEENSTEPIAPEICKLMEKVDQVQADDRNCLGLSRKGHENPQFRPLACRAIRGYICERPVRIIGPHNSTHTDVIQLGSRKYKIFAEAVDYRTASDMCISMLRLADLAVIDNFAHAQQLGRYLLIGRPSLENAWIGARWNSKRRQYGFIKEDLFLSNTTDATGYPPWRHNKVKKTNGCILLDRHIANITLFVESPCGRKRPYICYKTVEDLIKHTDVIIGPDGYRLVFKEMSWYDAKDFCLISYQNYSAKLVEIDTKTQNYNLLYVMGENKTAVQHIWIGGQLNDTDNQWKWITNWTTIAVDKNDSNLILNWLHNFSYTEPVEEYYVCLNMDRNNHNFATHYGTNCDYQQPFVCHFSAENLTRLQDDEKINNDW